MYTIPEIANRLIALCTKLEFLEAYTELYAEDAVSIDPNYKNEPFKGLENLIERKEKFLSRVEIHETTVSEPIYAGSYFSVIISMNFTVNGRDKKMIEELCVYKVENSKIVSQQFFIG